MATRKNFLLCLLLFLHFPSHNSLDSITTNQIIKKGDLLLSKNGKFAFGFFTPHSSIHTYLGIWFHFLKISESSVVWVANRNSPINGSSGFLSINEYGNLVLYSDHYQTSTLWSTNVSSETTDSCVAQLLDSGNLVLLHGRKRNILWQSFDYPTNTYLPGMRHGMSKKKVLDWRITSWRSEDDPGTGDFSIEIDPKGTLQIFLYEGTKRRWRQHIWPHRRFSDAYNYSYVVNQEEAYVAFHMNVASIFIIAVVDHAGTYKWLRWSESDGKWKEFWSAPIYPCDFYAHCGAYGKCTLSNPDTFECSCLPGYEPRLPRDWHLRDGSGGCTRKRMESSSLCNSGEGFLKVEHVKFPDTSSAALLRINISHLECERECLRDCSCSAYASVVNNESGNECLTWHGELIDTVDHMDSNGGFDMYVRVDAIELAENAVHSNVFLRKGWKILILSVASAWVTLILFTYLWIRRRKEVKKRRENRLFNPTSGSIYYKNTLVASELEQGSHPQDILFFDFSIIVTATNNFSPTNKLGQGGFGIVYKGQLSDGKEVAVKRLSTNSGQGIEELRNEIMLIAKLQHRNLVKLLGCCIEGGEEMLIYEYLPNKSLDSFIFANLYVDQTRRSILDWRKRFDIITGIARGILYLHQDSRLKIIHRDLKCSNILLDANMNPKISDFGMARIFRTDQIQEKTNRVVGTYGYMSPEYGLFGKFSAKSDVFSFGVIMLEIVSAKKNNDFHKEDPSLSLIDHVWELWRQDRGIEIVDSSLEGSYPRDEALRCIQIGLLCVQENAEDRPTMVEVVLMLGSEKAPPYPKQPAFIFRKSTNSSNSLTSDENAACSINELTISSLVSR
ncbi:G-type lectin S-receptor-like serine/threonine-protein kinase RKS1 isoform X2 [Euphorbia lathyris]|uniref:G-type lectin S-receptor-like serine/threonine-protein kinase RKS1 isoform X2 n=1 Tax=Euphorbia lathyris TaxID=212925 RepID=UPI0033134C90